jgi:hypothetical protein
MSDKAGCAGDPIRELRELLDAEPPTVETTDAPLAASWRSTATVWAGR